MPQAASGGAGPPPPSSPKGLGGDDGDAGDNEKKPGFRWKAWDDRIAADPKFGYKVLIE